MILDSVLKKLFKTGTLKLTDWKGRLSTYGDGTGIPVHIHMTSAAAACKIALDPDLYLGETYMTGEFRLLEGRIYDFLELALKNTGAGHNNSNGTTFFHRLA